MDMMNPELKTAIRALKAASRGGGKAIWSAIAEELDKPKRRRVAVNLSKINRHSQEGDIIAVPGKVLATGFLTHQVTIAAFDYSKMAREKIQASGSRAIKLRDLLDEDVKPSEIKILK